MLAASPDECVFYFGEIIEVVHYSEFLGIGPIRAIGLIPPQDHRTFGLAREPDAILLASTCRRPFQ